MRPSRCTGRCRRITTSRARSTPLCSPSTPASTTASNAGRAEAETALTQAGLTHEILTVPNVDHAFFNDTGGRYSQAAAAEVWGRALDWFGKYLA